MNRCHNLMFYVIMLIVCVNESHQLAVQYAKLTGRRLDDDSAAILAVSTVTHHLLCAAQCSQTDDCDSFNVNRGDDSSSSSSNSSATQAAAAAATTVTTSCELLHSPVEGAAALELLATTNAEWDLYTSRPLLTTGRRDLVSCRW